MKKLICTLFGHHYTVSRRITEHINEYKCTHCGQEVSTDEHGHLTHLTPEMQDINKTLESIYRKRHEAAHKQVA